MEIIALYIGLATVLGSIVGGVISTVLGRSQKVSSYRQDWINSLRQAFSDILLQCEKYTDVSYKKNEEAYREKIELIKGISKAKLFLNLNEGLSKNLISKIENIPSEYFGEPGGTKTFLAVKPKIEELMQEILKEEWNRVRDGEQLWRIKKTIKAITLSKMHSYPRYQGFFLLVLILILIFQLLKSVVYQ